MTSTENTVMKDTSSEAKTLLEPKALLEPRKTLLDVQNLSVYFHTRDGVIKAVDDVSFTLAEQETLAIVGESGSGKSVSCYAMLGLVPSPPGKIESGRAVFDGQDLLSCTTPELRQIRGKDIAMIFQDPMTSLNPFLRIGEQLIEPILYHQSGSRPAARQTAIELLDEVGIRDPKTNIDAYPHEFSGGMRQRVMIAMALIANPKLLIADEPTTALDVTIQKQILELLAELKTKRDLSVIFVSHDLGVVADIADRVLVMKSGHIVEENTAAQLFSDPQDDYTRELIAAIPSGQKPVPSKIEDRVLVDITALKTTFPVFNSGKKSEFTAVDDVSFSIQSGEILGLVGESGSGKSTIGRSILNLVNAKSGSVVFDGDELVGLSAKQMLPYRRRMQMIFQDPYASLNPRMTIYDTLAEPLLLHKICTRDDVSEEVLRLMDSVGLARRFVRKYPHEFSGGQRQRIAIGRAIATRPDFIIADEPVSALDVTIQNQILDLLLSLVAEHDLTMLFISHDLAVVRYLCDRVMVLRDGRLVESGPTEELYAAPREAYTEQLLKAVVSL